MAADLGAMNLDIEFIRAWTQAKLADCENAPAEYARLRDTVEAVLSVRRRGELPFIPLPVAANDSA